ncbi:intein [Murinocardiopsis flavida]|uniref:Intein n=1 Tax=Murinocardiopsis flavida TaxID=645275 RepID=A0A2P8DFY7_9ACTN|nr:polymorphic toxin-type HINT domain-containing protein [Murinocardiopsis flavida]PSK96121.1 intein [Murinocardiopsis flavida]
MLLRIHDPDRGASLVEYAALIVLSAAVLGGLLGSGVLSLLRTSVQDAVDALLSGDGTAPQAGPGNPTPSPPPGGGDPPTGAPKGPPDSPAQPEPDPGLWPGLGDLDAPSPRALLSDLGGIGTAFHPGGGSLQRAWLGDAAEPALTLPTPDLTLAEYFNPSAYAVRKYAESQGVEANPRPGGLRGHFHDLDTEGGAILGGILSGTGNAFLHPVEAGQRAGESLVAAGDEIDRHQLQRDMRLARQWQRGDYVAGIGRHLWDNAAYNTLHSPFSPGNWLVNDQARGYAGNGAYGKAGAHVLGSLADLVPGGKAVKGLGAAGKGGAPPAPAPAPLPRAGGPDKPGTRRDGEAETPRGSCKANSFLPATPVLMADGSTQPISAVQEGEEVLAFDPRTGREGPRPVTDLIAGTGTKDLVEITLTGRTGAASTVTATAEHPFWAPDRAAWVDAEDVRAGTRLRGSNGAWATVAGVEHRTAPGQEARNLTVAGLHTYYVMAGDQPVLVHNDDCGDLGEDWTPRDPAEACDSFGCEQVARQIQGKIGGQRYRISDSAGAPYLGQYRGHDTMWRTHEVVIRDGRVYDEFTDRKGMPVEEWKQLWEFNGQYLDFEQLD